VASDGFYSRLVDTAAAPYRTLGHFAWHFARGKLRVDPVFTAILKRGLIPGETRVVDLGCGQGVLLALLLAAEQRFTAGHWPGDWARAPRTAGLLGIDLHEEAVRRAAVALGDQAVIIEADLRDAPIPDAGVAVILDVLHYLEPDTQEALLDRVRIALPPGGRLIARVGDAAAGARFALTCAGDWFGAALRGQVLPRFHTRTIAAWIALLGRHGFAVEQVPMSAGPPFANVLLDARK
jgi:SAM-dependent methyltransferase